MEETVPEPPAPAPEQPLAEASSTEPTVLPDQVATGEPGWMILKENGKVYGPFTMEVVVGWIEERKIHAAEEVSPDGIEWWSFGEHEEFSHYFHARLDGIAVPEAGLDDLRFRRKTPFRDFFRSLIRLVVFVGFTAAMAVGVWHSAHHTWLVFPEHSVTTLVSKAKELIPKEELPAAVSGPRPDDVLIQELVSSFGGGEGSSWEELMRGRHLMIEDTNSSLRAARVKLEAAVALNPANGLALAALAELYNVLAARSLGERDLQRKSIYLLERAQESHSWQAELLRARATFLIYSEHPEEVEPVVREAIALNPRDAQLHFLLGLASKDAHGKLTEKALGHFSDTLELDPGFHGVWYELGRSEELVGRLWKATEHYEKKIDLSPSSPATLVRLGGVYEALGKPDEAAVYYDRAIQLDPDEKAAVLRRSILAYQRDGQPAAAAAMLAQLETRENVIMDIREKKEFWCHLSAAQRLAGDPRSAIATADRALAEDPNYPPALFHKAVAMVADGAAVDSLPLFTRADAGGLDNWSRALIQFQEGRSAHAAGQLADAVDAYDRAIDAYPAFMPAFIWRADVRLDLGDPYLASAELIKHLGVDPLEYARPRTAGLYYEPLPPLEPLVMRMLAAASEQTYAPQLHTSAGLLLFHDGRFEESSRVLIKALDQSDRSKTALFYSALIAYRVGDFPSARKQFDRLLEVSRSKGIFHVYRADTLFELDQFEAAAESFRESFSLGIRSSWVHGRLAEVLVAASDPVAGWKEIERGVQLDSDSCSIAASRFRSKL